MEVVELAVGVELVQHADAELGVAAARQDAHADAELDAAASGNLYYGTTDIIGTKLARLR